MIRAIVFSAALAAAGLAVSSAAAQSAPQVATAEQVAAAKAHADAVIARSQAGDFFVNITTGEIARVRHVRSGMVCSFAGGDDRDAISFYPVVADGPRHGDDVSCASWWGATFVSMFATRYPQGYSADYLMSAATGDIHRNWQKVEPLAETLSLVTLKGQEPPLAAAFHAERDGRPRSTMVVLRNIDGWSFKTRATGPADDSDVIQIGSAVFALSIPGGLEIFESLR